MSKPNTVRIEHKETGLQAEVLEETFEGGWSLGGWTLVDDESGAESVAFPVFKAPITSSKPVRFLNEKRVKRRDAKLRVKIYFIYTGLFAPA